MKKSRLLGTTRVLISLLLLAFSSQVASATITQQFSSSWTISPWDYYGDVAAMDWHYLPYQPWSQTLGTLTSVEVNTVIDGWREDTNEDVRIRYSFATGWEPADYQFHRKFYLASGTPTFSHNELYSFTSAASLANWSLYQYYPPANYYFESRTVMAAHTISATTTLAFTYSPVPIPASVWLFGSGLLGLFGMARRRS